MLAFVFVAFFSASAGIVKISGSLKDFKAKKVEMKKCGIVNGKEYDKSYITYDMLKEGMDLHFVMSARPNYKRGISDDAVPPSLSRK